MVYIVFGCFNIEININPLYTYYSIMPYTKIISSGSIVVDDLLDGGFDKDKVCCVYGVAASGKTTLAMLTALEISSDGGKVLFIDTENGFSVERFKQLSCGNLELLNNIFVIKIKSFYDQLKKIESLEDNFSKFSLIIIDTIGSYYRKEIVKDKFANKQLVKQLEILKRINKERIPILITNQVYTDPKDSSIQIVGGKIMKDYPDCLIELVKLGNNRVCVLRKHYLIKKQKEKMFKIVEKGFIPI